MSQKSGEYPDLKSLLAPDSIAVVGASEKSGPGRQVLENLAQLGYSGAIYPVNPGYEEILGLPCYPSLTEVHRAGHSVEMVAILLNRSMVIPVLEEAASIGVRAGWAFANGFGEAGPEGRALQQDLASVCTQNNILFCGPNCVGYLHPRAGVGTYSAPAPDSLKLGSIGLVAQSGYLTMSVANSNRGLGFSMLCSSGNEAVVDSTDFISYMLEDPGTEIVLAFIEQFRRPERLPELANKALEVGKPIILIKTGRSAMAQRATVAHTGAIAGSDDVQDALFKKLGIVRVDDFDEMFETAELFSTLRQSLPEGNGIFSLSLSGGAISLLADLGEELDLRYPSWSEEGQKVLREVLPPYAGIDNPLDAWGFGRIEETYETCLMAAAREGESDLVLVSQDVPDGMASGQVDQYAVVAKSAVKVSQEIGKPVVMISNPSVGFHAGISDILGQGNVPLLQGTREGLKAVKSLMSYAHFKREKDVVDKDMKRPDGILPDADIDIPADWPILTEFDSKKVLTAYGIHCPPEALCASQDEALQAAESIGYPVTLKVVSPRIQHKTEAGIIGLNLGDADAVKHGYDQILMNARVFDSSAPIDGVLCQKMITGAVAEAIVGILMDHSFGPSVVFGLGGVMVEILRDRALGIPPLNRDQALEMINMTKGSQLLFGFRGSPLADLEALTDTLVRVSWLAVDWADRIEALDINPLLIMPEGMGVAAVDALIELKEGS
ncbi:acetate--CoA ligase family protein [Acidobacteriota bacterium]